MKCKNCGAENLEDSFFCVKCGNDLRKELEISEKQNGEENNSFSEPKKTMENSNENINAKEERIYIIIAIISILFGLFVRLVPGMFIASIAIITGKIKCPDSKILKILFWLVILMYVVYVIFVIGMMIACNQAVQTFPR